MAKQSGGRLTGGGGPGGGIASKATHAPTTYFTGQPSTRINPKGVSQIGQNMGNHATDKGKMLRGQPEPVRTGAVGGPGSTKLGNKVAEATVRGPGGSRTIYGAGTQKQNGGAAGKLVGPGVDILNSFGPDSAGVRGRK
jgi:hypothetical protein